MSDKKLSNEMLIRAFEYREEAGKLELTAKEIADIVNERIFDDGETVSRQAVHYRATQMMESGDSPMEATRHGKSKTYYLSEDIEAITSGYESESGKWHCPNCRGGFPESIHDGLDNTDKCPWCGQMIDGSYECETPRVVSRTAPSESESDSGGFLGLFK